MEQERSGFAAEKRADNDNRKPRNSAPVSSVAPTQPQSETWGQWWRGLQPTKMTLFWLCLASILLTMLVGFNWGGWVRSSTAQRMADVMAKDTVIQRLATICVAQFNLDPAKTQKLQELQATSAYQRAEYVITQGWATLPGEEKPENRVADMCAKELMASTP
jgi:hypothetical protein